jgi:hypothetical protein
MTGIADKLGRLFSRGAPTTATVRFRQWSISLTPKNNIRVDRRHADSNHQDDLTHIADSLGKLFFPMFTPGKIRPVRKSVKKLHS